jgi:hypothetical protein
MFLPVVGISWVVIGLIGNPPGGKGLQFCDKLKIEF